MLIITFFCFSGATLVIKKTPNNESEDSWENWRSAEFVELPVVLYLKYFARVQLNDKLKQHPRGIRVPKAHG